MKQTAIIWKKSVYDNNFACPRCGNKMFDVEKNKLIGDATGFIPPHKDNILCMRCMNFVGVIREIDGDGSYGLQGLYDEKKYGAL